MEWYVYTYDINCRKMRKYNILANRTADIKKIKKKSSSMDEFSKLLRREMMYYYWGKSEWEIIISAWCGGDGSESIKVDVFDQLQMNWEVFVNYCWNFDSKVVEKYICLI